MITSEQASKMVEEKMARESAPAQPEPEVKPEPDTSTPEPKEEPKPDTAAPEPEKKEPEGDKAGVEQKDDKPEVKPEEDEKKPSDDKPKPKKKYTHEERVAHAFSIEKQKRKEQHAKDRARIKELEEKLKKYEGLSLKDFQDNVENDTNYRLEERDMQNEVKATKERVEREEAEEMAKETERRVNLSFESEDERDDYNELLRTNGPKFYEALQKADPNGVVLDYLNSVEKYPIVLRKLMTDMDSLRYVFRDKDPVILRYNLHQFTKELLEGKKPEEKLKDGQPETTPTPEPKKPTMPIIGKQVTANGKPAEPVHDRNYWNDYLRKHPHG
jgi:hypothetical protein